MARHADAHPDREERRGHDGGATFSVEEKNCPVSGVLWGGEKLLLDFFLPKKLSLDGSDIIDRFSVSG